MISSDEFNDACELADDPRASHVEVLKGPSLDELLVEMLDLAHA